MRAHRPLKKQRSARGQALVMACLSFLVLALMVTLSFNLSHALRQKVSLQQHSDSMAYSMAVMEARALNYYAVSNRAIAASYVAMNSMHAYMAAASVTGEMMRASRNNFYIIAAMEFAECACWTCFKHCIHGIKAIRIASKFGRAGRNYDGKVKDLEDDFNRTNKGLDTLMETVHLSQNAVHLKTAQAVLGGTANGLSDLTDYNSPGANSLPAAVGGLNTNEFNCSIDGMVCMGGTANSATDALARVMTEVANASRPGWTANRETSLSVKPLYLHPSFLQELTQDIPGEGLNYPIPFVHKGTAKTVERRSNIHGPGQVPGNTGKTVAGDEEGAMFNQWKDGIAPYWPYEARIWSDTNGGGHSPRGAHSAQHDFDGVNTRGLLSCVGQGNCFMKFRANPSANKDYGQPRVYSYVTRQFRVGDLRRAPWELNTSGELGFTQGAHSAKMSLAAGEGAGLSKALVYYHRFGENGWREAPNMFNPYWRAKLHPFTATEAATVLGAAGNTDAAQLAATPGVSL